MKANKIKVLITAEALSIDAIPSLIYDALEQLKDEKIGGSFEHEDGDRVVWDTIITPVNF